MIFNIWYVVIGVMLIAMALIGSVLKRLPLTPAILYLFAGSILGPVGLGLMQVDPIEQAALLERLTEIVVLVSLFSAGLKLRTPFGHGRWRLPVRLASLGMIITVGLVALVGTFSLGLPLGAAILLGAILAPTDPVLASDVQVEHPTDRDRLRFGLTGEAGLNDGTAFPFVMLGLGLLGLHDLGEFGWRWLAVDVIWAVVAGLSVGGLAGTLIGRLVIYLRRNHREAVGLDDFLALGLIALANGVALLFHGYGFLAVFAAGLALRRVEMNDPHTPAADEEVQEAAQPASPDEMATDQRQAPTYMTRAVLGFNEQLERIGEISVVVLLGGLLSTRYLRPEMLWFVPLLLLVIRPLAVIVSTFGERVNRHQRGLISWFGIRGVGSIYYLTYALTHGLPADLADQLIGITLTVMATSIIVHGISVTPLMERYKGGARRGEPATS